MAPNVPGISVTEFREQLTAAPKPYVLDVREPWEFQAGHVPEAHLIPLGELEQRVNEVPPDHAVFVICQSGQRSWAAAAYLLQRGYRKVVNVDGGTGAWIERGYPISR
jgi:rhodanese-related sulfurtransferase